MKECGYLDKGLTVYLYMLPYPKSILDHACLSILDEILLLDLLSILNLVSVLKR